MEVETNQETSVEPSSQTLDSKKSRPLWAKISFFAIVFLILTTIGFLGYMLLGKETTKTPTNNSTEKTASSSATLSKRCGEEQEFTSNAQGYSVCFTSSWLKKQLKISDIAVGFDKTKVDESFPGTISIRISDKSENLSIQDIISNSLKYEYSKTTLDSTRGTRIVWERTSEDSLSSFPKSVDVVIPKYERTYTISLISNETDYSANLELFENFLNNFKFQEKEPELPWSESRNILVYYPWPNDTIKNPIDLEGVAIAFEGTVSIRIKDSKGKSLIETTVQAESGTERSVFKGQVSFDKSESNKGFVEIFTLSPKDGQEQDKVTIPVNFQK